MNDWSNWNWINVFFVFFSGYVAVMCFKNDNTRAGWVNLLASSVNLATVAMGIL